MRVTNILLIIMIILTMASIILGPRSPESSTILISPDNREVGSTNKEQRGLDSVRIRTFKNKIRT